jgi:hypothetical protein
MTTVARVGGAEAVGLLLPYLSDESVCIRTQMAPNSGIIDIQTRDVALASLLVATEQKVADYGYQSRGLPAGVNVAINYSSQWFESDDDRKKGFEKWAAWAKANPKAVEVKAEKK